MIHTFSSHPNSMGHHSQGIVNVPDSTYPMGWNGHQFSFARPNISSPVTVAPYRHAAHS